MANGDDSRAAGVRDLYELLRDGLIPEQLPNDSGRAVLTAIIRGALAVRLLSIEGGNKDILLPEAQEIVAAICKELGIIPEELTWGEFSRGLMTKLKRKEL
jgi:hypothetical protein